MRNRSHLIWLVFTFLFAARSFSTASAESWTQWRGPDRTGLLTDQNWPQKISYGRLKSKWQTPLGSSYSSPLVTEDRVFVTETRDQKTEVVSALSR